MDEQTLRDVTVINIDNKANNQGYGDIVLVSPEASSVSEHVGDIALTLGFSLEQDSAQNLLNGIMTETRNFQDPKTSSLAFEIASFLMKRGARRLDQAPQPRPHAIPAPRPTAAPNNQAAHAQQQDNYPTPPMPRPAPAAQPAPRPQPVPAPRPQPAAQPQPVPQPAPAPQQDAQEDDAPPLDWLTPKVYKGSSDV